MRWFVHEAEPGVRFQSDLTSILIVAGVIAFVFLTAWVHIRPWPLSERVETLSIRLGAWDWRLLGILAGIMLIINAATGVFLAHNLKLESTTLQTISMIAQAIIGVLLLFELSYVLAGVLVIVAAVIAIFATPWILLVDYVFEFVGLAITLILIGPRVCRLDRRWQLPGEYAGACLRIAVGASLMVLAIHNKLADPGLGVAFLAAYPLNFMAGFGFSDLHFVLAAGVFELAFGSLIAFGIATRFVTAVLSCFFVATLVALSPVELIGHLPLIGAAIVIILRGGSVGELKID
jgi:hypothetical protein